jgi:hypothetical protein
MPRLGLAALVAAFTSPRKEVGREQGLRIADASLDAPRHAPTATTAVAYTALREQSSRWYTRLTGDGRRPIRVVFTHCLEPYTTAAELSESVRHHRLLELWPTIRDHDRRHPLLDREVGGAYDRFRSVHDIVSHGWCRHAFDADGEFAAWLGEDRLYTGLASWALATELHGKHSVLWTTESLADHKAVLLEPTLLRAFLGVSAPRPWAVTSRSGDRTRRGDHTCASS